MSVTLNMRTLVVELNGSLSIREIPRPAPGPKEALVKTIACGMCGTDIKLIHNSFKGFSDANYPLMLGHEGVGEVVEIGAEVKGLKIGDKVLLPFVDPCHGLGSGYGALSEYAIVQDAQAHTADTVPQVALAQTVLPPDLDPIDAVTFVTFREVLSSIRYFGIKPEDSIVVFGCGPVGLTFIKLLSLSGCKNIIAVDLVDDKLAYAIANGAKKAINSKVEDVKNLVRELYPTGVNHVLDAVGLPIVANQAMHILKDRGNILCYGVLADNQITLNFGAASYNWNFICQQMPEKAEEGVAHKQILEWVQEGKLVMKDFISDYFPFDDSVSAYDKLLGGKVLKKGIITF